jgi:hypothetical protein
MKTFTCRNLKATKFLSLKILSANYTRPYMGLNKHKGFGTRRLMEFSKGVVFRGVSQIKSYIMQRKENMSVFLTLYIDNLLIISKELQAINEVKGFLLHEFKMFLNEITYCLGIKIIKD